MPVRVVSVGGRDGAAWAEGLRVHIPAAFLERAEWRSALSANGDLSLGRGPVRVTAGDVQSVREHRAFTPRPPASARLPVHYHVVPGWARAMVGSAIGRWNRGRSDRWASFPRWPVDLSADFLSDVGGLGPGRSGDERTPVVLTHDIDSPEGLENLLILFAPLEEACGARSTSYVVPCAWPVDRALLAEVRRRGHEVGVHGYDHGNRTPFAGTAERQRRLDAGRAFGDAFQALGYRAPSLLRTRELLRDLAARYHYDSSIPTTGGLFPTPNNGCATARPFVVEGVRELPVSMPRDGTLRFLGYQPDDIARLWIECAELIARSRGAIVILTHCERRFSGNDAMLRAYRCFLEYVAARADRFAFSTPGRALALAA
jgi:peptidoglycan/xylan/chitin deacetylase (PgdA/CDA1 family)